MPSPIVDSLYAQFSELRSLLDEDMEISLRSAADSIFRKALLLSAASLFEHRVSDELVRYCAERADGDELLQSFVRKQALDRKFHTLFEWNNRKANSFFGLFGDGFKKWMREQAKIDPLLQEAIDAFLELGSERNQLVHQNFAAYPMQKTSEEIYNLYLSAAVFVDTLPVKLREYTPTS